MAKIIVYEVDYPSENEAGLLGFTDKITVHIESGSMGGEEGEFERLLLEFLEEWYDCNCVGFGMITKEEIQVFEMLQTVRNLQVKIENEREYIEQVKRADPKNLEHIELYVTDDSGNSVGGPFETFKHAEIMASGLSRIEGTASIEYYDEQKMEIVYAILYRDGMRRS